MILSTTHIRNLFLAELLDVVCDHAAPVFFIAVNLPATLAVCIIPQSVDTFTVC